MAWYDEEDSLNFGDAFDISLPDFSFDLPSFELPSFDALDLDWGGDSSFSLPSFELPSIDALDLDWGNIPSFNFDLPAIDATDLDWGDTSSLGLPSFDLPSIDALDLDWGDTSSFDFPSFDEELPGGAIGIGPESEIDLFGGVKFPDQKVDIPATSLYKAADEVAETVPGETGLTEPEMPSLSSMGGAQGSYVEVPAQFDKNGELIDGTGGYVGELGFVPYDAVAAIGDPASFINRPDLLDKTVIGKDMVSSADLLKGTTTTTTPGGTTTTKTPTDTKTTTDTNTITKI